MFYPDELDQIFCGTVDSFVPWDIKALSESCKPDHGYSVDSDSIINLFSIMAGYDQEEQRAFLQFVTGCPRLPIGSFKSLSPPLTIVKKTFDTPEVCVTIISLSILSNMIYLGRGTGVCVHNKVLIFTCMFYLVDNYR